MLQIMYYTQTSQNGCVLK